MKQKVDKRNWEILYSDYSGPEKKAVELINKEMGALILRDKGIYTFHTLTCKKISSQEIKQNAVVIGTYNKNEIIKRYIKESEIPEDGYIVKVIDNPDNPELKLALITAFTPREVFYGAVDFVDDYFAQKAFIRATITFYDELFEHRLPDYCNASAPVVKTRNIFTWGHPISDYEGYIDNMARMKLNQLIIWNDYAPVNAGDIVEYAHKYGISVIWGFAWGWSRNCSNIDFDNLDALTEDIIRKYEEEYRDTGADGIYFQSFTELSQEYIGGKLVAEAVTDFVNKTADRLLEKYPELLIQFGLHATSVKDRLMYIQNTDKRVDIIWEDCGTFPYSYIPCMDNYDEYQKTKEFTADILNLREGCSDGVLFKGNLILDWEGNNFVHQSGPYIMGKASKRTIEEDRAMIKPLWKKYQNAWLDNGEYAYEIARHIADVSNEKASVGIAGQLTNGIWFPTALTAQILWECDKSYAEILQKVLNRRCVDMV